ncbi:MAG: hypothetical protein LBQ96_03810, partial [Fusobacteriaceae bacterium]|nr:hypothetical protein [Fusobacteriaceae bacterium]
AVESESTWLKGKMDGVARNFYENGVIMSESVWAEGEQWGETTNYLADGTIDKGEAPAAPAAPAEEKPFVVEKPVIVMTEPEHKPAESETVVAETPVTTSEAVVVAAPAATEAVTEKPATRTVLPVIPYDVIPAPDEPQPEKSNLEPKVAANQS